MRTLTALASSVILAAVMAGPTLAAGTGIVSAQITVDAPCLTLSTTSIDLGHAAFSTGTPVARTQSVTYTSCSTTTERITARATDASSTTGSAQWTLVTPTPICPDAGPDKYAVIVLKLDNSYLSLSKAFDVMLEDLPGSGAGAYSRAGLFMPCTGSSGSGETMSFQITYTATF